MSTDSYLEHFTLLLGWILNNAIWNILLSTGIFALPLVLKLLAIWVKVREEGDDEGNKGALALPRIEHALYIAFVVIMFCAIPTHQIDLSTLQFDNNRSKQCGVQIVMPEDSGYAALISDFNGQVARVPVWWAMVHSLSKGITRASIASIPCGFEFRQLRFNIQHSKIKDPILRDEIQEFANQCYSKAYYRLKMANSGVSSNIIDSVSWIGSEYFLITPGYYDYYTSTTPRIQWPYSESRDNGFPDVGQGGYPTCKTWWETPTIGLKNRVIESYDKWLVSLTKQKFGHQAEEILLRWLVSPKNAIRSGDGESYTMGAHGQASGLGGNTVRLISTIGTGINQFNVLPGIDALKQALPIVQALIEMVIIIIIPLLLLFSAYSLKTALTTTFALFAIYFVSFWWELAGWLDDRLIKIIYDSLSDAGAGSYIPFADFVSSTADGWIMNIIMASMYIVIPMIWFGTLGWAGVMLGNVFTGAIAASKGVQQAGEKGGSIAKDVIAKAATAGKKL